MSMISVRFTKDMYAAVRRFASQDGVTVSKWLRDLIDAALKDPQRARAIDYTEYGPQPQTVASGACSVELSTRATSVTGNGWVSQ